MWSGHNFFGVQLHMQMASETYETSILLFLFQPPAQIPLLPSIPALGVTTVPFSAQLLGFLWGIKACAAIWRHALTRIFPHRSCAHLLFALLPSDSSVIGRYITFWSSSTPAPQGANNIVLGLGSCYSPAYHRLQHVSGKPALSLHLSVSFTNTFSLFLLLSFLFSLCYSTLLPVPTICLYTGCALSITVAGLCVWYLQNVWAMQPLATKSKNRDTCCACTHKYTLGIQNTDHMIIETIVMMISFRTLKKSHMTFPRSPILPMQIPKVMKKPIKPSQRHREFDSIHSNMQCSKTKSKKWSNINMMRWKDTKHITLTKDVHAPFVFQFFSVNY